MNQNKTKLSEREIKKVAIYACYSKNSRIKKNSIKFLDDLSQIIDAVIVVGDFDVEDKYFQEISKKFDILYFKRHCKYDFGSYQIGFNLFKENFNILLIEDLFLINDSIYYNTGELNYKKKLHTIISCLSRHDFSGLTLNQYGYVRNGNEYRYERGHLHIQSFFLHFSKKIFCNEKFIQFMDSISKEKNKHEIIIKYEMGLSKLLVNSGYNIYSYYDCYNVDSSVLDPSDFYLSMEYGVNDKLFIKRRYIENGQSDLAISIYIIMKKLKHRFYIEIKKKLKNIAVIRRLYSILKSIIK